MLFKRIELQNYGIYKGDHVISFPELIADQTVTLIGGLNGRGKTTLLEAVFLVLYGRRAIRFLQDERISYSEYLRNHINKGAKDKQASITLTMLLDKHKTDTMTIKRYWSIEKNDVKDHFMAYKGNTMDCYLSENWDFYVEEILPLNISRFFFFDNEKISQIADEDSYESVKDSIKSLLGLTTIDQLIIDMKKLIKRVSNNRKTSLKSELSQKMVEIQQDIEQSDKDTAHSVALIGRLNRELGLARKQHLDLEDAFWRQGGNLGLKREEIEADKERVIELLGMKKGEVMELVDSPVTPLLLCKPLLERTYNQVQQDNSTRSARYSSTIIDRLKKILPASIRNKDSQQIILDFLLSAQDELIQGYVDGQLAELTPVSQSIFSAIIGGATSQLEDIRRLTVSIQDLDAQINQIQLHLNFDAESNEAKALWEKMRSLSQKIMQLDTRIHIETEKQRVLLKHQQMLENRHKAVLNAGVLDGQNEDEALRLIKYASMTSDIMHNFKVRIQTKRVQELEQQIFACFNFIAQKETMIQRIEVNPETLDIRLVDYLGGELLKNQLSAGEKQIFAISILWGLAKCSGYEMPVIIDTPLGRLDSNHRTSFVKRYLPHASRQVVVLSTDEEIYGKYYKFLKPYVNGVFLLDYNEETKSTSLHHGYFGEKKQ